MCQRELLRYGVQALAETRQALSVILTLVPAHLQATLLSTRLAFAYI